MANDMAKVGTTGVPVQKRSIEQVEAESKAEFERFQSLTPAQQKAELEAQREIDREHMHLNNFRLGRCIRGTQ